MTRDKRRDPDVAPDEEPFTNIQTYEEPSDSDDSTARDDAAIGFERPPVRPKGGLVQ